MKTRGFEVAKGWEDKNINLPTDAITRLTILAILSLTLTTLLSLHKLNNTTKTKLPTHINGTKNPIAGLSCAVNSAVIGVNIASIDAYFKLVISILRINMALIVGPTKP